MRAGTPIAFENTTKQISNSGGLHMSTGIAMNASIGVQEDPLHILKVRLAKKEITKVEYDKIRKALE